MKHMLLIAAIFACFTYAAGDDGGVRSTQTEERTRCWAVTQSGNRCKRRARPGTRYCKQHASDVKPSKPVKRCMSMTDENTQCTAKPVQDRRYCERHMDAEKEPSGGKNVNAKKE